MANIKMKSKEATHINSKIINIWSETQNVMAWKNDKELIPEAYLCSLKNMEKQISEAKELLIKLLNT